MQASTTSPFTCSSSFHYSMPDLPLSSAASIYIPTPSATSLERLSFFYFLPVFWRACTWQWQAVLAGAYCACLFQIFPFFMQQGLRNDCGHHTGLVASEHGHIWESEIVMMAKPLLSYAKCVTPRLWSAHYFVWLTQMQPLLVKEIHFRKLQNFQIPYFVPPSTWLDLSRVQDNTYFQSQASAAARTVTANSLATGKATQGLRVIQMEKRAPKTVPRWARPAPGKRVMGTRKKALLQL